MSSYLVCRHVGAARGAGEARAAGVQPLALQLHLRHGVRAGPHPRPGNLILIQQFEDVVNKSVEEISQKVSQFSEKTPTIL